MTTAERVLSLLRLFTEERSHWTVDEVSQTLGLSRSTAYAYVRALSEAGLIVATRTGQYVVGPAVVEMDRLSRRSDPFILACKPHLEVLSRAAGGGGVALLCRFYRSTVMCVDQSASDAQGAALSYERGRPMPLLRGSASKVILANLPMRFLRRYFETQRDEIARAGLGDDWGAFLSAMKGIRKKPVCITMGELDAGRIGVSAAVFDADHTVLGSISLVLEGSSLDREASQALSRLVAEAARSATNTLCSAVRTPD